MNSTVGNVTSLWEQGAFAQTLLFGITVGVVARALILFLIGLIFARFLRGYLLRLSTTTKYVWIINEDTASTLHNLIVVVATVYALDALGILSLEIAGASVSNLLTAFLVFYFSYLLARKSKDYMIMRSSRQKLPEVQVKAKLFYYTMVTLAFFIALNIAGFTGKLTTLLAAAGITGIILGFASQTVVANFISGIFMYFDRPLKIGDAVRIGDFEGIVHDIRILSTRIRQWDGTLVRIPNERLFNSEIINLQRYPARRAEINVGIAYKEDAQRAIDVIMKVLEDEPIVLAEPEPRVYVRELGDSSVNITIWAWVPSDLWLGQNLLRSKYHLLQKIKEALEGEGIEIPFPQRVNWFAEELRVRVEEPEREGRNS
ncbi:mechanosensitive ion channel family protein [Palaeococcus ferrophilus]|uniref:mechanosensitive ion channel family protein n=1 Tax=Palaeococcus ferrophilus TaxID=83868 RepID=UPI000B026641|nr:mechanosensitive ion channel family protein [Palaeococcus ferrophilus]